MDDPRNDPTPEQILAAEEAARDQALAGLSKYAEAARVAFTALEAEGFSPAQALYLTGIALVEPDFKAP